MGETSIEERMSSVESSVDSLSTAVDKLSDRVAKHGMEIDDLRIASATTNAVLERIDGNVTEISRKLDAEREKPAERWDAVINQVITVIVAAVVGLMLAKLGFNL